MKRLRSKLTYANVISTLCLFLVLGGGAAFAAGKLAKNSVGTKQIKKNAVTSAKIKNKAVTNSKLAGGISGSKLDASSLGKVPSASSADNSGTVDGNTVKQINFAVEPSVGATEILSLDGFTLTASCPSSTGMTVVASGPAGSRAHTAGLTTNGGAVTDDNTTDALTSNFDLLPDDNDLVNGETHLDLGAGGRSVTIVWSAESFPVSGPDCTFVGYAFG